MSFCRRQVLVFLFVFLLVGLVGVIFYFKILFIPFYMFCNYSTFVRPYMGTKYVYKPNFNFLEMAHTSFFSSIQQDSISAFDFIKKRIFLEFQRFQTKCDLHFIGNIYFYSFYTFVYVEGHTA